MLIIFDLDDTLINTDDCIVPIMYREALRAMVNAGLKVDSFEDALELIKQIDQTSPSGEAALAGFLNTIGAEDTFLAAGIKRYYEDISVPFIDRLEGANEIIRFLRQNHQLALVTKGVQEQQWMKIKMSGINHHCFSKIIVVENGSKKEHYQKVLEELNYSPSQACVCGDSFERDLLPAKELGMKTILMRWGRGKKVPPDETEIDYCISELKEIKNIL